MKKDAISVIIPVYNGALHLGEAIESALAQTVAPEAIIVVDDGSKDETPQVAARFGSSVHYVQQAHRGAAQARNTGVRYVESEYLAFLDSDDIWEPQKLERQLTELRNCEQPAMIFGHFVQFASPELAPTEVTNLKFDLSPMRGIIASALCMRVADFHVVGSFDPKLRMGEFIEWYARARDKGIATKILSEVVFHRRIHRSNHGRLGLDAGPDYARAIKTVLERRKQVW